MNFMINDFLTKQGFRYCEFKGEMIYKGGDGFFEIPKCFSFRYTNGMIRIEAWTRMLWLPGVYGQENDLTGFMAAVPKNAYKKDIEQLIALLHQPVNNQQINPMPVSNPQNIQPNNQQINNQQGYSPNVQPAPVMVQGFDTVKYANLTLGFGIVGLCMFWSWFGLLFDILAFVHYGRSRTSSKKGRGTAGLVCAIIGVCLLGIVVMASVLLNVSTLFF